MPSKVLDFSAKNITLCIIWSGGELFAGLPTSISTCGAAFNFPFADLLFFDIPIYVAFALSIFMYDQIIQKNLKTRIKQF